MLRSTNADILLGCESWLDDNINNEEILPEDYTMMQKDRNREGGGISIAHKRDLVMVHHPEFETDCELIWAQLQIVRFKSIFVGSFYRPPFSSAESLKNLEESIQKITAKTKMGNIWLGGDFNLADICWETASIKQYANNGTMCNQLLEICNDAGFSQMVTEPTCTQGATSNIVDLFLTTDPTLVQNVHNIPGFSD